MSPTWFLTEFLRSKRRNAQIPPHARMIVTNPVLSAHARRNAPAKPPCAAKGCTNPATEKPYDDLPATCAVCGERGDASLIAAVKAQRRPAPAQDGAEVEALAETIFTASLQGRHRNEISMTRRLAERIATHMLASDWLAQRDKDRDAAVAAKVAEQAPSIMEAQNITPACRSGRGSDGAWDEAVRRLREIYDAQVAHDPDVTLALAIYRGDFR